MQKAFARMAKTYVQKKSIHTTIEKYQEAAKVRGWLYEKTGGQATWLLSAVEVCLLGLPESHRRRLSRKADVPYRLQQYYLRSYADCIWVKCKHGTYCIGTDKIGHFFEVGGLLAEIAAAKNRAYAEAFGRWTEGLYTPPDKYSPAEEWEIYNWLQKESFLFLYGHRGRIKLKAYERKWGGFEIGVSFGPYRFALLGGLPSPADQAANIAGMRFWDRFFLALVNEESFSFDICDYVTRDWVE
jgi:hypothetical protein